MARSDRIQVTVSLPMRVALAMLARRNGITISTQATIVLRQALDRTIGSEAGQAEIRKARSYQTVSGWREDRTTEREVESEYNRQVFVERLAEAAIQVDAARQSASDHAVVGQKGTEQ